MSAPDRPQRLYVIYDERAILGSTVETTVLEACASLREVRRSSFDGRRDPLGAVYEYDVVRKNGENCLENERFVGTVADLKRQIQNP